PFIVVTDGTGADSTRVIFQRDRGAAFALAIDLRPGDVGEAIARLAAVARRVEAELGGRRRGRRIDRQGERRRSTDIARGTLGIGHAQVVRARRQRGAAEKKGPFTVAADGAGAEHGRTFLERDRVAGHAGAGDAGRGDLGDAVALCAAVG